MRNSVCVILSLMARGEIMLLYVLKFVGGSVVVVFQILVVLRRFPSRCCTSSVRISSPVSAL